MRAFAALLPAGFLTGAATRVINEVKSISQVVNVNSKKSSELP